MPASANPDKTSLLRHYLWKYRKLVGLGLGTLILVDILEVLPPIFLKWAVDGVMEGAPRTQLVWLAVAYAGTAVLQGLCRYGWRMFLVRSSLFAGRDLRQRYADHLFSMPPSFFDRRKVGDLMSLATNDVDAVRMALGAGLLTIADAFFYFCTVPVAMYLLSPKLTLIAFATLPLIPWIVYRNEKEIHARFERVQEAFARLATLAQENLSGVRVVKAFAREDSQARRFREAGEQYIGLNLHLARVQSAFGPTMDFFMSLGLVLLLYFGGGMVIGGAVGLGTFVAFQRYIQKMVWPMMAVGLAVTFYQRAVASSGRLLEALGAESDVPDPPAPARPARIEGAIELRGLTFRYAGADRDALQGLTLSIRPGERLAVVGGIGSGKSTLLSLIPRLYPVADGMLSIDGVDVNRWSLAELRRNVAFISQDVFVFSESVLENIAYGLVSRAGDAADRRERLEQAARKAAIHDELLALSAGYDTRIGERGVTLSGGQKQRLTIARAVVRDPAILVLDDALSSVDTHTEERILRELMSRRQRGTELIAAHRISTVKDADRILVLHEGRLAQLGPHRELIRERGSPYHRFYEQQRLREDLEAYAEKIDAPGMGEAP